MPNLKTNRRLKLVERCFLRGFIVKWKMYLKFAGNFSRYFFLYFFALLRIKSFRIKWPYLNLRFASKQSVGLWVCSKFEVRFSYNTANSYTVGLWDTIEIRLQSTRVLEACIYNLEMKWVCSRIEIDSLKILGKKKKLRRHESVTSRRTYNEFQWWWIRCRDSSSDRGRTNQKKTTTSYIQFFAP